MGQAYWRTMFGAAAKRLQEAHGSRASYGRREQAGADETLGAFEREFIAARDSFYLGSVTADGWPYIQHRGGPQGFLRVLDDRRLAFADYAGNKQYITAGNLATNDRVSLFLMDYPEQARLKLIGHARLVEPGTDPALDEAVRTPGAAARVERILVIDVAGFDWSCSQHITQRFTPQEFAAASHPSLR